MITDLMHAFQCEFELEIIDRLPPAGVPAVYYSPGGTTLGGKDGCLIQVTSRNGSRWIGMFAGEGDVVVGSCPDPNQFCVVAGGTAVFVNAQNPEEWSAADVDQVQEFLPLPDNKMILLVGLTVIQAVGPSGPLWTSGRLSYDGITITQIGEAYVEGEVWDPTAVTQPRFQVNLTDGKHTGGAFR